MEKAVYITRAENLHYLTPEFSRLYFGQEFCQRLMPSKESLETVARAVSGKKTGFTFVTPFVTDEGLDAVMALIDFVLNNFENPEIVVNDWGVYRILSGVYEHKNLVLGRLLTKLKKGPRILRMMAVLPHGAIEHFKLSPSDSNFASEFLKESGFSRLEFDNLLQGIKRPPGAIKASLYVPYVCVTVTRYCLYAVCSARGSFARSIPPCERECGNFVFSLKNKNMPADLILKGTAQFFENHRIPPDLEAKGIDRIVYQPEIPV